MKIVNEKPTISNYRSRLFRKATALLARQSEGAHLDNQKHRIIQRWQRQEALKRLGGAES